MKQSAQQQGAALIAFMIFLLLGIGVFLVEFMEDKAFEKQKQLRTQKALTAAKTALIAYAVSDANRPGELPCPDIDNDGKIMAADGVGGNCASLRGWLPWFLLGLGDIRDGDSERLWYAINDSFRSTGVSPPMLNPDTQTDIVINGIDPTVPYVAAIIMAPGKALSINDTNRTDQVLAGDTADDRVASYFEGANSGGDKTAYTRQSASDNFNDMVMLITVDEIMQNVGSRVKQEVINEINRYRTTYGFYPYAESSPGDQCDGTSIQNEGFLQFKTIGTPPCQYANVLNMPAWFEINDWHRMFWLGFDPSCQTNAGGPAVGCATGGLTVNANNNVESLVLYAAEALDSVNNSCGAAYAQSANRPSGQPCDYFDNSENYDLNSVFTMPVNSVTSNDELVIISP
jgi:hypothetical protein